MTKHMEFKHVSVLLEECINGLNIRPGGIYVDGTMGGAGHTEQILKRLDGLDGKVIGVDRDEDAVLAVSERLKSYGDKLELVHDNFSNIENILKSRGISHIDGLLLDLGVSSHQIDTSERGFSYMNDGPLDMRMDKKRVLTAKSVVNEYSQGELTKILFDYGEEKFSKRIVKKILEYRAEKRIETTSELSNIIKSAFPASALREGGHPAKRTFQAIRIEVNDELGIIPTAVKDAVKFLTPGGRIVIITFHSLEDRIVKNTFKELARGCLCPSDFPVCVCGNKPELKIITNKPLLPTFEETEINSRSKSAKLRIAEKI